MKELVIGLEVFFRDDDSTSADDEIIEVSENDEIEEILNEPFLWSRICQWLNSLQK